MMMTWLAFGLSLFGAFLLTLAHPWRWRLGGLALQYLGLFWLVQPNWSGNIAAIALISGWMTTVVLAITLAPMTISTVEGGVWSEGRVFRFLMMLLVVLVSFALALRVAPWLMIGLPVAWGGLFLGGTGLLLLGLSQRELEIVLGLLTMLIGFEALYANLEASILVAALLTFISLGMALAAAYLLSLPPQETKP